MQIITIRVTDPFTGQQQTFTHLGPIQIGRAEENTLILDHPQVAHRHAVINQEGSQFIIRSFQKRPDLLVNGQLAVEAVISEPTTVQIGPFILLVMFDEANYTSSVGNEITRLADSDVTVPARRPAALA